MVSEYTDKFYQALHEGSEKSARAIVPLVLEYVQPRSIIDVGCGTGTWLSVFREYGVIDIMGVDGDYVENEMLEIPEDRFMKFDLRNPFRSDRQFDLVVSLEVAEHLPSTCAGIFVRTLVGLGPLVLFSAAIPLQGGTQHINEQWPDYWADLFKAEGYVPVDPIRKRAWQNPDVDFWYLQNILIFVKRECLGRYPALRNEMEGAGETPLSLVHPRAYLEMARQLAAANESCTARSIEAAREKAEAELLAAENERQRAEVEVYKAQAEPANMGLRKVLSVLPIVLVKAAKRRIGCLPLRK
jgi:SAM-dependent methyltransferase